ncbi:MAG: hypothetical protein JRI54_08665 [Deltaproteobacteria bacterium]|nr:hypothetical protein [Deltaproteobacteria bacterium]
MCKIEWHYDELFPGKGFIVTNSNLPAREVVKIYNGRANVENRIKKGKNTTPHFISRSALVGACGLGFSAEPSLPGSAWVWVMTDFFVDPKGCE